MHQTFWSWVHNITGTTDKVWLARKLEMAESIDSQVPNQSSQSTSEDEERWYLGYWHRRLYVYRQILVWLTRVLTLQDRNLLYLVAVFTGVNAVIMLLMAISLSYLILFGLMLLTLSASHAFSVTSKRTNRFKLIPQWGDSEEQDYVKICRRASQIHMSVTHLFSVIFYFRGKEPKKFYGIGILVTIILSNVGYFVSTPFAVHVIVNSLLLFPLILHHKLHTHFLNQNWSEIVNTITLFAEYLKHNIMALFQHFTRSRKRNTRTNQSHVTHSASQVTSNQSHVTSLGHKSD